ncbi:MAG: nucleotidyltransferase domain-containing protein [Nanoarchaeota archaeon]|nr:nucleotidyltransferase domain-containing protein [Nanoarchaeota archaeon]
MDRITDKKVNKWLKDYTRILRSKYGAEKIILFGSRARKDHLVNSDVDLIVVSRKFYGMNWIKRVEKLAKSWKGYVDIEPLCYTPEEFEEKSKQIGIVRQAVKEGILL